MLPNVFNMGLFSQLAFGHSEFFFKIWFLPLWACSQVRKPRRSKSPRLEDLDFCRSTKFNFLVYLIQVNPKVIQVLGERTSFHESSIFGTRFLSCLTGPLLGSALLYRSTSRYNLQVVHAMLFQWSGLDFSLATQVHLQVVQHWEAGWLSVPGNETSADWICWRRQLSLTAHYDCRQRRVFAVSRLPADGFNDNEREKQTGSKKYSLIVIENEMNLGSGDL